MYNHDLKVRILEWMQSATESSFEHTEFEKLALQLWADQVDRNPEYGRWSTWVLKGKRPHRWQDIPAVPVTLFRDLSLTCFPAMLARYRFRTSGTTGPRGQHAFLDTEVYDNGSILGRDLLVGSVPNEGVSLVSNSADSSLGHMCRLFAPTMHQCFLPDIGVLVDETFALLRKATTPQFIPATAFAMASLLRDVSLETAPILLPHGSVIMITGGFKGRTQEIEEDELIQRLHHLFPNARIVGEYGMTELSSQLWSSSLSERFRVPPWLKVVAVDPHTGMALPNGQIGQLKFVDLANHQTVLAIETRDQGIVYDDGSMELLGRLPKSDARGCSLSVEEVDRYFVEQLATPTATQPNPHSTISHTRTTQESAVRTALEQLRQWNPEAIHSIAEGLSEESAVRGWHTALNAILAEARGFDAHLSSSTYRPDSIGIVLARGVFTAGLEWVALGLASGASVHVKVPTGLLSSIGSWLSAFQDAGLPLTFSDERTLPTVDLLWIFGDDNSIETIQRSTTYGQCVAYGHRFSLAITTDSEKDAEQVATDISMYDTRGCMAPVAVFCTGDADLFTKRLFQAMRAKEQQVPLGVADPFLGPEYRRRIGLAVQRQHGYWLEQTQNVVWGVLRQESRHFTPSALPRLISVYQTSTPDDIDALLRNWNSKISTIGLSRGLSKEEWLSESVRTKNPRICTLGTMQQPPFYRLHDGKPMWPQK